MIKHLVLDIGGVLTKPKENTAECMKTRGINVEQLQPIWEKHAEKVDRGEMTFHQHLEKANEELNTNYMVEEFQDALFKCININQELIKYAKNLDTPVSILSDNHQPNIKYYNKIFNLHDWTKTQVYSYQHGILKPNTKIYKILLDKLNTKPQQCLFIDDVKSHVEKAKKLGMKSIQFKNNQDLFAQIQRYNLK